MERKINKEIDDGIKISKTRKAYKLLTVKKTDNNLYPLFIDKKNRIPINEWIKAKSIPTPGFKIRSGWHSCQKPSAPHLSEKRRKWFLVEICNYKEYKRPSSQGGKWYISEWIKVIKQLK